MLIAIPLDSTDKDSAKIAKRDEAKAWALIDFDEGEIKGISICPTKDECEADWIDFVVLENKFENYLDFMEEGIMVLVRRKGQDTIDLIIEGFKFKELDEIGL